MTKEHNVTSTVLWKLYRFAGVFLESLFWNGYAHCEQAPKATDLKDFKSVTATSTVSTQVVNKSEFDSSIKDLSDQLKKLENTINNTQSIAAQVASKSEFHLSIKELSDQLTKLNNAIDSTRKTDLDKFMPIIVGGIGFFGAILGAAIGALVTYFVEKRRLDHDKNISREHSIFDAQSELIQEQRKRRSELYAPLKTLLGQSKEVYDQMCRQLKAADVSKEYEWITDPDSTSVTSSPKTGPHKIRKIGHLT